MLRRRNRLPSTVRLTNASTFKAPNFTLRYLKTGRLESRLAIVVSKRIDKRAVHRNRMRRLISAFMQERWDMLISSMDMIIIVNEPFIEISRTEALKLTQDLVDKGVFYEKTNSS